MAMRRHTCLIRGPRDVPLGTSSSGTSDASSPLLLIEDNFLEDFFRGDPFDLDSGGDTSEEIQKIGN